MLAVALEAEQFKRRVETIFIEGHTDNVPISNGVFPSNWELSAKRAINTWLTMSGANPQLTALRNDKDEMIFSVSGYADTRPIADNGSSIDDLRGVAKRLDAATFAPDMNALKKFVDKLGTFGKDYVPTPEDLKILRLIDFTSASHLRRVVSVYLTNYDNSNKTELLRRTLNFLRGVDNVRLRKIFAAREELFGEIGLGDYFKTAKFIQVALTNFFRAQHMEFPRKILADVSAANRQHVGRPRQ